jgi:hypothetical protein
MINSKARLFFTTAVLFVFVCFVTTAAFADGPLKTTGKTVQKQNTQVQNKTLNKTGDINVKESPNVTGKNEQASGSSDETEAAKNKKKILGLEDEMPNPMESQVNTNAGKALDVEKGVKGPGQGGDPVNPEKMNMNK